MSPGELLKLPIVAYSYHITQTDAYGAPTPPEELVKLFWELEGISALNCSSSPSSDGKYSYIPRGEVTKEWLDKTFAKVGDVVAETVKAGAECGSFGLQFMPNAFEVSNTKT